MEVSEIVEKVNILDYISQYTELSEKGGEFWGLSPFKSEVTPSFSVNPDKQTFYDFSTGFGGNLIEFVKKLNKCDLSMAIEAIKKFAGITDSDDKQQRLIAVQIAKRYKDSRPKKVSTGHTALAVDYMNRYQFNTDKLQTWVDEGISLNIMKKYNVSYDAFSDRIVFPIKDDTGAIISICGRTLDKDYKAKGLRKYTYFTQINTLDFIYGLSDNRANALAKREIILFEGAKSVMLADMWGFKNCGAVLTSHLNDFQLLLLAKLGVSVVFALDKEVKIPEDKTIQKLKRYVPVSYICDKNNELDEKMSPADKGEEVFRRLYKERVRLS